MKLLVATSNPGKLVEIREILGAAPLELLSLAEASLPAPDETGLTFHENAGQKAVACAVQSGLWTLGDDSGLCVDALDGGPGVFSARYAPTDVDRRAKLLRALQGVPDARRGAHFFCAMALSAPSTRPSAHAPRGTNGFGYDPLFLPAETPGKTLAELEPVEKNRLSHRGRALERLLPVLARLAQDGDL